MHKIPSPVIMVPTVILIHRQRISKSLNMKTYATSSERGKRCCKSTGRCSEEGKKDGANHGEVDVCQVMERRCREKTDEKPRRQCDIVPLAVP